MCDRPVDPLRSTLWRDDLDLGLTSHLISCVFTRNEHFALLFRMPDFTSLDIDIDIEMGIGCTRGHSGGNQRDKAREKNAKKSVCRFFR